MSPQQMIDEGIVPRETIEAVERTAIALYRRGAEIAEQRGLILVDTKYEFGTDEDGKLVLIDEIHSPDSSRYWQRDTYDARFA